MSMAPTIAVLIALPPFVTAAQPLALADATDLGSARVSLIAFAAMAAERPFQRPIDIGPDLPATTPADAPAEPPDRLAFELGAVWTNAYYFRGIRQEDDGFIIQPSLDVAITLVDSGETRVGLFVGTWNSVHGDNDTGAPFSGVRNYYEADVYGGVSITHGRLTLDTYYTAYTSPSDAFRTVHEFDVSLAYSDADDPVLGPFTLNPYVSLAFELRDVAADGRNTGGYAELGIAPAYTWTNEGPLNGLTLSLPLTLGLSLYDYFEDARGEDDAFGFFDIGLDAAWPLPTGGDAVTTLNAGVHLLTLGDNLADINGGDETELVVTAGISIAF